MPQRRRRIFIIGYHKSTDVYKRISKSEKLNWLQEKGTIANAFPIEEVNKIQEVEIKGSLEEITTDFNKNGHNIVVI